MLEKIAASIFVMMLIATGIMGKELHVGYPKIDGPKFDVEFQKYNRTKKHFKDNYGIDLSLIPYRPFVPRWANSYTEKDILKILKPYHVFILSISGCGSIKLDDAAIAHAKKVGRALRKYVEAGGGLWLNMSSTRYPGDDEERYQNIILEAFDAKMLHEGVFDKNRRFDAYTLHRDAPYFSTNKISKHPITKDIKRLCLPLNDYYPSAGVHALKYGKGWKIVVRGEKAAKSYLIDENNELNIDNKRGKVGTYQSSPPIVAVKSIGKGRVVSFPLPKIHWYCNVDNPVWLNTVEFAGDREKGFPSDTMKLIAQALKWVGKPAQSISDLGTHKLKPYQRIQYPASINLDEKKYQFPSPSPTEVRGVFGLRSNYGGGKSTVAEYAKAAKKAGLSFIVFNDPLEKLTKEKLESLKKDCAAVSEEDVFYACPGVEYTDGAGLRWAQWGEKTVFPKKTYYNKPLKREYPYWDGKILHQRGAYAVECVFPGSAIISYDQLRSKKVHPENLWWYFHFIPFAYDGNKKIADNTKEILDGLDNLTWTALTSYQKINSASELTKDLPVWTSFARGGNMKPALNTRCNAQFLAWASRQYVSQGPRIRQWEAINSQMEINWRYTRGTQRVQLSFDVESDRGIREVKVLDSNSGPIRVFKGNGKKQLKRQFELVHDKQHWLILEVTDVDGKKAYSWVIIIWAYKQGLARCGDNLNILGPTGICWHPDRSEMFQSAKNFENGWALSILGWDQSNPLVPRPTMWSPMLMQANGRCYPEIYKEKKIIGNAMDVQMSNYQMQMAEKKFNFIQDKHDTDIRPQPPFASPPVNLGSSQGFERTHRIISLRDRADYYTIWNGCRDFEGRENYRGGLIWHEGEVKIKKDVKLDGNVPIPLIYMSIPVNHARGWGKITIVNDGKGKTDVFTLANDKSKVYKNGVIEGGGYILRMPTPIGYHAVFVPSGMQLSYDVSMPGRLRIGLGKNGQKLKAGDVIPYRYAVATVGHPKAKEGNGIAERTAKQLNIGKKRPVFQNTTFKAGSGVSDEFFIHAKAKGNECWMIIKNKEEELTDRAFIIEGIQDNGCPAVYTKNRPWFRFIGTYNGKAYFQENIDYGNDIWVGNVFVTDNPKIKLTLIVDGQSNGTLPFIEVHNPTERKIKTKIISPANTPIFGGIAQMIEAPAGDSIFFTIKNKKLIPSQVRKF